jgi:hypothetical protein
MAQRNIAILTGIDPTFKAGNIRGEYQVLCRRLGLADYGEDNDNFLHYGKGFLAGIAGEPNPHDNTFGQAGYAHGLRVREFRRRKEQGPAPKSEPKPKQKPAPPPKPEPKPKSAPPPKPAPKPAPRPTKQLFDYGVFMANQVRSGKESQPDIKGFEQDPNWTREDIQAFIEGYNSVMSAPVAPAPVAEKKKRKEKEVEEPSSVRIKNPKTVKDAEIARIQRMTLDERRQYEHDRNDADWGANRSRGYAPTDLDREFRELYITRPREPLPPNDRPSIPREELSEYKTERSEQGYPVRPYLPAEERDALYEEDEEEKGKKKKKKGGALYRPLDRAYKMYSASKDVSTLRGGSWDNWGGYNRVIGGGDLDDPTFDPEPQQRSNRLLDAGYQVPFQFSRGRKGGLKGGWNPLLLRQMRLDQVRMQKGI